MFNEINKFISSSVPVFFFSLLLIFGANAFAATCSVTSGSMNFGAYNPFLGSNTDSNSTFSITCNGLVGENVAYTATLTSGSANGFSPRKMVSGAGGSLNYNFFVNSSRTTIMGDGTSGTSLINDSYSLASTNATKSYSLYGRVFALQNVPVGVYSDTLTLQISF